MESYRRHILNTAVCLTLLLLLAPAAKAAPVEAALATQPRVLEFQGGFAFGSPLADDLSFSGAVLFQLRYFPRRWLYCSGVVIGALQVDSQNPEHLEAVPLLHAGLGAGLRGDLAPRVSVYAGAELAAVFAWSWPGAAGRTFAPGARVGPTAGLALWLGRVFGHPLALEVRGSYAPTLLDSLWLHDYSAGLLLSSVLLPEP